MHHKESQIEKIWKEEQEILDVIHEVCMENNLCYSLAYGTLLGAIRHKGFIPWDDDIDLMMPRKDYEKLLDIWNEAAPEGYILQNVQTNSDFTQNFTKIRKNHTTFLQFEFEIEKRYHKGIFVDIFPVERAAPGKIKRKVQYIACAVALLYTRGHSSGLGGIIGAVEKILLSVPKNKYVKYRKKAEKYVRRWNDDETAQYMIPCTIEECKCYYPADMFDHMQSIVFNGKVYQCVSNPDAILQINYGDYMKLPPEKDRVWKHHPLIIDFEHNYEEIS